MEQDEFSLLKEKISNDDGILIANDIIYCAGGTQKDFDLIKDKILEFYNPDIISIILVSKQKAATVIITDRGLVGEDIQMSNYVYDSEINYAISNNQRIIPYTKFSEAIHSKLVIIEDKMFNNLIPMIKSKDRDSMTLACEIMSNANRTNKESIKNIIKLTYELNDSLISGINKKDLCAESPHVAELFNFLERAYYDEYKGYNYIFD